MHRFHQVHPPRLPCSVAQVDQIVQCQPEQIFTKFLQVQQKRVLRAVQPPVLLHPDLLARHAQEDPAAPRPLRPGRHRRQVGQLLNLCDVVDHVHLGQGGPVLVALHPRRGCLARRRPPHSL